MAGQLLASSNTEPGIVGCINAFYYSKSAAIEPSVLNANEFKVFVGNRHIESVRVVKKARRYRFEMVA